MEKLEGQGSGNPSKNCPEANQVNKKHEKTSLVEVLGFDGIFIFIPILGPLLNNSHKGKKNTKPKQHSQTITNTDETMLFQGDFNGMFLAIFETIFFQGNLSQLSSAETQVLESQPLFNSKSTAPKGNQAYLNLST